MLKKIKSELNIRLSAVVATDRNWAIGKGNSIPWKVPSDLKYFKEITLGHHLIMGRKTYDSIGKPLPGRMSIVCTKNAEYNAPGSIVALSMKEALQKCPPNEEIFVVGGEAIYREFLPLLDLIYLTEVNTEVQSPDTFFPELSPSNWLLLRERNGEKAPKDQHSFTFKTFMRSDLVSRHISW